MGKTLVHPTLCPALDSFECDNCGESALVLKGRIPVGWHEQLKGSSLSDKTTEWICFECKSLKGWE